MTSPNSRGPSHMELLIPEAESRWEDPYVDFKRDLFVATRDQKAEFVKDVLGLVNTMGASRRFLMVGWDDRTRQVIAPGLDPSLKVERLQNIVNAYCDPPPHLELSRCARGGVPVGVIEVRREAAKVPYRIRRKILGLQPGDAFVRHGTITERPSPAELDGLHQEGLNARLREAADPLIRPDQVALRFAPLGLMTSGLLHPASAVRHQATVIDIPLVDAVPEATRKLFVRLQTIHMHGLWSPDSNGVGGPGYQLFTVAHDYALEVLMHALAARFVDYYGGAIDVLDRGDRRTIAARTIADLYTALEAGIWRVASRRRPGRTIRFNGSLRDLFGWARHEGLIPGQSTRRYDLSFSRMHGRRQPIDYRLGSPPDSSRLIREVGEFINRIWGADTPEGDIFRGPQQRHVAILAWNEANTRTVFRPEQLISALDKDEWMCIITLSAERDDLLGGFHSDFALTACPSRLVSGPMTGSEACEYLETHTVDEDTVDELDQLFVLPIDRDEWARTLDQFAGLPHDPRQGRWALIRADSPWSARNHIRQHHAAPTTHRLKGECNDCWADCLRTGSWGRIRARLAELDPLIKPQPPRNICRLS